MNTRCPSEDRLKALIGEAFDELPGADTARLGQIGRKIGKQARSDKPRRLPMQHWLFWLLFGAGMAAAAWWGGRYFTENTAPQSPGISSPAAVPHPDATKGPTSSAADKTQDQGPAATTLPTNPVIIDRRERY